jgi:hypothetical protein
MMSVNSLLALCQLVAVLANLYLLHLLRRRLCRLEDLETGVRAKLARRPADPTLGFRDPCR